jgi:hypothetical protein
MTSEGRGGVEMTTEQKRRIPMTMTPTKIHQRIQFKLEKLDEDGLTKAESYIGFLLEEVLTAEEEQALRQYENAKSNGTLRTSSLEEARRRLNLDR